MGERLTLTTSIFGAMLARATGDWDAFRPRYNIAPGQHHWVVRGERRAARVLAEGVRGGAGGAEAVQMESSRWGLPGHEGRLIDALGCERISRGRARSVDRCVVPLDGFYKWIGDSIDSAPLWFHSRGGELLWGAGICGLTEHGQSAFCLVTCPSNALVDRASARMPLLLTWRDVPAWLARETSNDRLLSMMHPPDPHTLAVRVASSRVNFVDVDDPLCVEEAHEAQQLNLL